MAESAFLRAVPRFSEPNFSANVRAAEKLRELGRELGVPASSLAIAWLLAQGQTIIPIPGTRSIEHLRQLATGVTMDASPEVIEKIEQALPVGWAHGDRYSDAQWIGPESYC